MKFGESYKVMWVRVGMFMSVWLIILLNFLHIYSPKMAELECSPDGFAEFGLLGVIYDLLCSDRLNLVEAG